LELTPIKGLPVLAAKTEDGRHFLVLSDIHLGLASMMGMKRPLPEEEVSEVCRTVDSARCITGARSLIILGDLKHGLFMPNVHERKALRSLTERLAGNFKEVWIVKGNHDYGIDDTVDSRIKMIGKGGLELDGVAFIHGHSLPRMSNDLRSYDAIVTGHIHPQLQLSGEWKPVWLFLKGGVRTRPRKVVVLPHFNKYASRASYRPGPPATLAPFMARLEIDRYIYEMWDLDLNKMAEGEASAIVHVRE